MEKRKAIVTQFLKELFQEKNIALSDTQIEILIEAAVKQMKIQENAGIVIEATDDVGGVVTMGVRVGSARSNENGGVNGKAGVSDRQRGVNAALVSAFKGLDRY